MIITISMYPFGENEDKYLTDEINVSDPTLLNTPEFIYTELMIKLEAMIKQVRNNSHK